MLNPEVLFEINQMAARYYHQMLLSAPGSAARAYLINRGVSMQMIKEFELGFSLNSFTMLTRYLESHGVEGADGHRAGLLVPKRGTGYYDRFRRRIMFPIRDSDGLVRGFGARSFDGSEPKYTNSPGTEVFSKSALLYALDRALPAIKEQNVAIVVEGYMDTITAHQYGFANVVATMGTTTTTQQAKTLRSLCSRVILALDGDLAGRAAILNALELTWGATQRPRLYRQRIMQLDVMVLPHGKDPDGVMREDLGSWRALVARPTPWLDFVIESVFATTTNSSEIIYRLVPYLTALPDPLEKAKYVEQLCQRLHLPPEIIWSSI